MADVLAKLIAFRKKALTKKEILVELFTDINSFKNWIANEGMRTPYIVDFGIPLNPDTEITVNYMASKWIIPNDQYLFYNDNIGIQLFEFNELDNLINQQLLCSYLVSPFKLFPFVSRTCCEEFLEFDFSDERA